MRTLFSILGEGLLDDDFEVKDTGIFTLKELGYKCTNMECNTQYARLISVPRIKELFHVDASYLGDDYTEGFDEYTSVTKFRSKIKCGANISKFAWLIRLLMDNCVLDAVKIVDFMDSILTHDHPKPDIKITKNKVVIKHDWADPTPYGKPLKYTMQLTFTK